MSLMTNSCPNLDLNLTLTRYWSHCSQCSITTQGPPAGYLAMSNITLSACPRNSSSPPERATFKSVRKMLYPYLKTLLQLLWKQCKALCLVSGPILLVVSSNALPLKNRSIKSEKITLKCTLVQRPHDYNALYIIPWFVRTAYTLRISSA